MKITHQCLLFGTDPADTSPAEQSVHLPRQCLLVGTDPEDASRKDGAETLHEWARRGLDALAGREEGKANGTDGKPSS